MGDRELENILEGEFEDYLREIKDGDRMKFQSALDVIDETENIDFTNTHNNLSENFMNTGPP